MSEEMQANANLREEMNRWQTQVHLRQYERLEAIINFNKNQQRQEEEMPIKIITVGESSDKADEVSCKSLYQSSRIGPIQIRGDEDDNVADNNNMDLSLELTLGLN
ncbi:hypothetical protein V5N11_019785 [Cardamine amara subsp. amara]|uniref:MADS-box transcription factor n=1 Tax=Cardamine amara subsp. amara TaxID=228776 RepID=A0ABD1BT86_CARAN